MLEDKEIHSLLKINLKKQKQTLVYLFIVGFETHIHRISVFACVQRFLVLEATSGHFQHNFMGICWPFIQFFNHVCHIERCGIFRYHIAEQKHTIHIALQLTVAWQFIQIVTITESTNRFWNETTTK